MVGNHCFIFCSMSRLRKVIKCTGVATAVVGGALGSAYVFGDEGTKRSLTFWGNIFPAFLHYRWYQLLDRDLHIVDSDWADQQYEKLHEKYSDRVKHIVYSMRGFYLKNAQVMSTQDDFVPPAYMRWVKDTQDNVPSEFKGTEAREYVRLKLKEELNQDFDEVFSYWDDTPLGVASIGQVHKAVLRKTGQAVAVKLLVPGIEERFRSDIKTFKRFCELAMPQHVSAFAEIEKQFLTEFDYVAEAKNLSLIHSAITPKWGSLVKVPQPFPELCSKHLLVMEFLEGPKLVDGIRAQYSKLAALKGTTLEALEAERKEAIKRGDFTFQTLEQSKLEQWKTSWYLAVHDYLLNPANLYKLCYNYTPLVWWTGPYELQRTEAPVDLARVLELLCQVHANEIFEHGAFNGDPHPGNILLLKDGRLGLIDYGQVKTMTTQERITYAKLIIALARDDRAEVQRIHFQEQGVVTKRNDPEVGYLFSAFYNDRDTPDVCKGMNIANFIDHLEALDPMVKVPEEYIMASRVSIMMRGMGKAFGLQLRMSKMWEKEARDFLRSQGIEY